MKRRNVLWALLVVLLSGAALAQAESFDRSRFRYWIDADGDGEDSRQEAIIAATASCVVCPYSGSCIEKSEADVDHIVPLRWAWDHGAAGWTAEQRERFANDPDNLLPVLASLNRAKGAKGPESWLPPNLFYVPIYCATWATLCRRYSLGCDFEQITAIISRYLPLQKGVTP